MLNMVLESNMSEKRWKLEHFGSFAHTADFYTSIPHGHVDSHDYVSRVCRLGDTCTLMAKICDF